MRAHAHRLRGQITAAIAAGERALAISNAPKIRFLTARVFVEAGEIARAKTLAAGLASELQAEPQAYAKTLEGMIALENGDPRQAIKSLTEANALLDTWIGRFDLGRGISRPACSYRPIQSSIGASSGVAKRLRSSWTKNPRSVSSRPSTITRAACGNR